jgi:mannan endo-1,4-beta-mannosidase
MFALIGAVLAGTTLPVLAAPDPKPVTPDAMPEAVALLRTLYALSGRQSLTGQHNYPNTKSYNSDFAARYLGHTPAVFSSDWGHALAGNSDSYLARPDIVQEAIRQHRRGALVTLCWHAVPPTADEPITFRPLPGSDPKALKSVQGQLLDEQFKELLTPGTPLYQHWCAQVDTIAGYLKQLQDAHVPVLWRPYHEMNGDWFWWGGRTGEHGTAALYRQIFDRLVHHHQLKNLLWVWSMDRVSKPGMEHEKFFPGIEYVDVLGLDVYRNDFSQSYYDSLVKLSQGKPLALAEVGNPPAPEILAQQPLWTYYVTWAGMVRNTPRAQYEALWRDPRILNLDNPRYAAVMAPYREACALPPIQVSPPAPEFTGTWVLNERQSQFGRAGAASSPVRLELTRRGSLLTVRSTRVLEYAPDQVAEEQLPLDGTAANSESMNSPRVTTCTLSAKGDQIVLHSTIHPSWGPAGSTLTIAETWQLQAGGDQLVIERTSKSFMGDQHEKLVYDRR